MAALNAAIALVKRNRPAPAIAHDLDLDMPYRIKEALKIETAIAKGRHRPIWP